MILKMILERYQFIRKTLSVRMIRFQRWRRIRVGAGSAVARAGSEILQFDAAEDRGAVDDQDLFGIEDGGLLAFVLKTGKYGRHFRADFPVWGDDDLGA